MIKWLIWTKLYHQVAYQFQILPPQRHLLSIIQSSQKVDDDELSSQVKDGEQALAVKNMIFVSIMKCCTVHKYGFKSPQNVFRSFAIVRNHAYFCALYICV